MITVWIQDLVGHLMANKLAPAVTRAVTKVLPSASPATVANMVDQLLDPTFRTSQDPRGGTVGARRDGKQ
ncbi:hypothetical protein QQX10_10655 [Demequina sp. SYSU T00039]|uniref:Uncharacterized protein n=1 Tax=Demequina lignilytica TaxID=3051663 RepID=A0AAW7M637_9MICO|nr:MULTISPECIES: hypothetical protein [unclassified Demequina]MDN4478649.1 hypothetical protein [Demequina sp. SYSU T00039-1]MDN4488627.1 hypothetical protein [Demequina sp. SYSU T00039]